MSTISELAKQGRWRITDVIDRGAMDGCCSICSHAIRYEYHIENLGIDHNDLVVGSKCGPTLVTASEWKSMNVAYVETQRTKQSQNFRAMLDRYVALKPGHDFMRSIRGLVAEGRGLTQRQREAVQEVFSETDWEVLEQGFATRARIATVLPLVTNAKTIDMLHSFEAWTLSKPLTPNQMKTLESVERQAALTAKKVPTTIEEKLDR